MSTTTDTEKKTTVAISPDLHRALRMEAARDGEKIGALVERIIRKALKMPGAAAK